jgi:hypothetical protein
MIGHIAEKSHKKTHILRDQKNGAMLDFIRLLSVWSPVITIDYSEAEPVIVHYIQQTLNLTQNYDRLREVAFAHSPKGSVSKDDWLEFYENQATCDLGKTLTPPRLNKGKEMSARLKIINYQSTLKSLAKSQGKVAYAFSFNLSDKLTANVQKVQDNTKSIAEKLKYRFKSEFGEVPDFYLTAEFTKGANRLHYHGTILLNQKSTAKEQNIEKERVRTCFKQVNPDARSIKLVQQPDILNYWPIRWGSYVSKSSPETAVKMNHPIYATKTLKAEAEHHYSKLRELIIKCQHGTAPDPVTPAQRLRAIQASS